MVWIILVYPVLYDQYILRSYSIRNWSIFFEVIPLEIELYSNTLNKFEKRVNVWGFCSQSYTFLLIYVVFIHMAYFM